MNIHIFNASINPDHEINVINLKSSGRQRASLSIWEFLFVVEFCRLQMRLWRPRDAISSVAMCLEARRELLEHSSWRFILIWQPLSHLIESGARGIDGYTTVKYRPLPYSHDIFNSGRIDYAALWQINVRQMQNRFSLPTVVSNEAYRIFAITFKHNMNDCL